MIYSKYYGRVNLVAKKLVKNMEYNLFIRGIVCMKIHLEDVFDMHLLNFFLNY